MSDGSLVNLSVLVIVFVAGSLAWVYFDAQQRGRSGCLWLLIALFTWPLGVLAYAFLRDKPVQL